jgi:hypothetical protein
MNWNVEHRKYSGAQLVSIGMPTVLQITSTKHNKYVFKQKFTGFDDGNFIELFC